MHAQAKVEFTVRLLDDASDCVVHLLGSATELGAWDVARAVPMELVEQQGCETTWQATVEFGGATNTLEYKYVVKHTQKNKLISWEGLPGNRTLTIAHGTNYEKASGLTPSHKTCRRAPSIQSSTYTTSKAPVPGPRGPELGNNGNTNGFQEWRCCRTNKETNPWWEVDLGKRYAISSVHLWSAMTYHEQAKHPSGRPPITSKTSTSSPPPPLWMFISKEPLGRESSSFDDALAKAAADPSSVRAIEVPNSLDSRVQSLNFAITASRKVGSLSNVESSISAEFPPVEGRYVRLQLAGASCALQFAELEVFTQDNVDDQNAREKITSGIKCDDGFYGVSRELEADLREYTESGWLDPALGVAELKVWVGSFDSSKPSIQWVGDATKRSRVAIEMRHERLKPRGEHNKETFSLTSDNLASSWESLPVEYKSAALLDKDSTELRELMEAEQRRTDTDISRFLNNDLSDISSSAAPIGALSWFSKLAFVQSLEGPEVKSLSENVVTITYKKGESILQYAEQRRVIFYVRSGNVDLLGPESSTGINVIGTLGENTIFNEMGIFSYWSRQPVLFKAKTNVVCEVLEFEALLAVLGTSKIVSIRNNYTRARHNMVSSIGKSKLHYTDSTHAQIFYAKVPAAAVDGSRKLVDGLIHRWVFNIFSCQKEVQAESHSKAELLGSAFLLSSQIEKHGEAYLTLPIFSANMDIIGQLTLAYLVLTPFVHPKNNIVNVWRSYWREKPPLTIGHRGMGRSYYQVDGYRLALTRENTLASFILAGRSGADFVEFDVQLTKDRVPIIYHDFTLNVGLEDKSAGAFGTKPELYEIGIHDMSYRQLTQSYTVPVPHEGSKSQVLQNRVKKHWARLKGDKQIPSPRRGSFTDTDNIAMEEDHLVEFFPRLEDLLKHVPAEVGLNIEVKYPDTVVLEAMRNLSSFNINAYIDRILQCVFDFAGSRRIFFSCFDPSVCVALRAKQAKYPVLLLTYGSLAPNAVDARLTLQFAINFAKIENLQGIVSNSSSFLETPELAPLVKKYLGTVLMTWGDHNTNHEMVQLQKRHAIDGVISDNVIDLINIDRKLQSQANRDL
ncbi:hypothetical protein PsorP6_005751 [Peronosclerospora sorghi]|uniref:Uncharacterized protein n=1 Tax=Peronosclerospora sorghi TaxID=230839 RepID=A0ACC0W5Z1_9STRA|nr:hypothetical protein PsorP6_005751 [Peronosclerospora sorghi]